MYLGNSRYGLGAVGDSRLHFDGTGRGMVFLPNGKGAVAGAVFGTAHAVRRAALEWWWAHPSKLVKGLPSEARGMLAAIVAGGGEAVAASHALADYLADRPEMAEVEEQLAYLHLLPGQSRARVIGSRYRDVADVVAWETHNSSSRCGANYLHDLDVICCFYSTPGKDGAERLAVAAKLRGWLAAEGIAELACTEYPALGKDVVRSFTMLVAADTMLTTADESRVDDILQAVKKSLRGRRRKALSLGTVT